VIQITIRMAVNLHLYWFQIFLIFRTKKNKKRIGIWKEKLKIPSLSTYPVSMWLPKTHLLIWRPMHRLFLNKIYDYMMWQVGQIICHGTCFTSGLFVCDLVSFVWFQKLKQNKLECKFHRKQHFVVQCIINTVKWKIVAW